MDDEDCQGPREEESRDHDMVLAFQGRVIADREHVDEMMAVEGHERDKADEVDSDFTCQTLQTLGSAPRGIDGHDWASCRRTECNVPCTGQRVQIERG